VTRGLALKRFRKGQGLNQDAFAMHIGFSRETVSRFERGANIPDWSNLVDTLKREYPTADFRELERASPPKKKTPVVAQSSKGDTEAVASKTSPKHWQHPLPTRLLKPALESLSRGLMTSIAKIDGSLKEAAALGPVSETQLQDFFEAAHQVTLEYSEVWLENEDAAKVCETVVGWTVYCRTSGSPHSLQKLSTCLSELLRLPDRIGHLRNYMVAHEFHEDDLRRFYQAAKDREFKDFIDAAQRERCLKRISTLKSDLAKHITVGREFSLHLEVFETLERFRKPMAPKPTLLEQQSDPFLKLGADLLDDWREWLLCHWRDCLGVFP